MKHSRIGRVVLVGVMAATTVLIAGSSDGAPAPGDHLVIKTATGETANDGSYSCGLVFASVGVTSFVKNEITVKVVSARGQIDYEATGNVSITVSPTSPQASCPVGSPDKTNSTVLTGATEPIVHGVATFTYLNAAEPGIYTLDFADGALGYSGRSIILDVGGPNDPDIGVPVLGMTLTFAKSSS